MSTLNIILGRINKYISSTSILLLILTFISIVPAIADNHGGTPMKGIVETVPLSRLLSQAYTRPNRVQVDINNRYSLLVTTYSYSRGAEGLGIYQDFAIIGNWDDSISVVNINTGENLFTYENAHDSDIVDIEVDPQERFIASAGLDNKIRIWSVNGQNLVIREIANLPANPMDLDIAEINNTTVIVVALLNGTIRAYDYESLKLIASGVQSNQYFATAVKFTPDLSGLVSSDGGGILTLWDINSQSQLGQVEVHNGRVTVIVSNPVRNIMAEGSRDGTVGIWDLDSKRKIRTLTLKDGRRVEALAFSLDGKYLLIGDREGYATLWDYTNNRILYERDTQLGRIYDIRLTKRGNTNIAVASGYNHTINVFTLQDK